MRTTLDLVFPSTHQEFEDLLHQQRVGRDTPLGMHCASTAQTVCHEVGLCHHELLQPHQDGGAKWKTRSEEPQQSTKADWTQWQRCGLARRLAHQFPSPNDSSVVRTRSSNKRSKEPRRQYNLWLIGCNWG